ncbi:nitrate- and nitrite sensing domain-containing protein [Streptomyces ipomoeae]|nr:nitrate- and nitrite sensing domain-containing protein [Streptomyces ipomoeae]MDX2698057.1 nitrate- and nitrite sensing domain-containing protein [Streptomyces ipomoeae]MDX2843772.1 nitrate- and nitrite sensing domain-containing protein [Streptomyces ipomoeae]
MRAPVQKTRPRRAEKKAAKKAAQGAAKASAASPTPQGAAGRPAPTVGTGRKTHVRNRLFVAVAVVAAAIAGAGAPSILAASEQLHDSQSLVTLAERTEETLTLAHALADERDEVTAYIAAGRPKSGAPDEQRSDRVDLQVRELSADSDTSAALREDMASIADVRKAALSGESTALEAHEAYTAVVTELHALAEELAEQLPPRAGGGAHALAELDTAVQQAAAVRGLLVAALSVPTTTQTVTDPVTGLPTTTTGASAADRKQRDALTAAAQQARVRSDAALADFRETAPTAARSSYDATVTGPEADTADEYLADLTDQPTLADSETGTSAKKVNAALSARVDLMRGAESSLYDRRSKDLAQLRDDDVTALEIRIAVLGALMLVAVGIATGMARSLTRPLAVLRIGSARVAGDPVAEEPIKFTGRNDEFAQVVRSVNALQAHALALHERLAPLEGDRKHLIGQRQTMAADRDRLRAELAETADHLAKVKHSLHATFVNLALRTLGLVERQLAVIESLEEREQDPDRLATLFKLDHFATVMRRHSENLLVLAGHEHVQHHAGAVPLVDVVRAAVSEIERYERVRIATLPPGAHVAGFAADDLSHLLAELLENGTSFSPPEMSVEISGRLTEHGEITLTVQDGGIGIPADRIAKLNSRISDFDPEAPYDQEDGEGLGLGLYVVARLAHRLGASVHLREQNPGGVAAVVVLPTSLLAQTPDVPTGTPAGLTPNLTLPGIDAEANSGALPGRGVPVREPQGDGDPLIEAAEQALRAREAVGTAESARAHTEAAAYAAEEEDPDTAVRAGNADTAGHEENGNSAVRAGNADGAVRTDDGDTAADADAFVRQDERAEPEREDRVESVSETTMELFAPAAPEEAADEEPDGPYAIGPDTHERAADEGDAARTAEGPRDQAEEPRGQEAPRLTDKGLPKRTPRITAPAPTAPRPRAGGVNAEELRRRLGGFHQGAREGRRDVEAEIAEQSGETRMPEARQYRTEAVDTTGGTSEEASS